MFEWKKVDTDVWLLRAGNLSATIEKIKRVWCGCCPGTRLVQFKGASEAEAKTMCQAMFYAELKLALEDLERK